MCRDVVMLDLDKVLIDQSSTYIRLQRSRAEIELTAGACTRENDGPSRANVRLPSSIFHRECKAKVAYNEVPSTKVAMYDGSVLGPSFLHTL